MRTLAIAACALLAGCGQSPKKAEPTKAEPAQKETPAPKIASLYPAPGRIAKGQTAQICYGVENAAEVALDPPVERVWPALSRCFDVHPQATTEYTLTASDAQGRSDRKSITIEVGAAKAAGPHIVQVLVNKLEIAAGEPVSVCYTVRGAESVRITPGVAAKPLQADRGCITDNPKATTTYQVVATGPGGQTDAERVTVKVR